MDKQVRPLYYEREDRIRRIWLLAFIKYIGKRLLHTALVLLAVIILNFFLLHLAPGDVVDVIVGSMGGASAELIQQMRSEFGLDRSLPEQLFRYLM